MVKIETETDIEHLRQIALVLEAANKELCRRIERLEREVAKPKGKDSESLELEIKLLKEELCARQQALFAASSERRSGGSKGESSREPAVGHGPREQAKLPSPLCAWQGDKVHAGSLAWAVQVSQEPGHSD